MPILDDDVVNVALPAIRTDLHLADAHIPLTAISYTLTFGSMLSIFGRFADLSDAAASSCSASRPPTVAISDPFVTYATTKPIVVLGDAPLRVDGGGQRVCEGFGELHAHARDAREGNGAVRTLGASGDGVLPDGSPTAAGGVRLARTRVDRESMESDSRPSAAVGDFGAATSPSGPPTPRTAGAESAVHSAACLPGTESGRGVGREDARADNVRPQDLPAKFGV
jgi:hypothetical protein